MGAVDPADGSGPCRPARSAQGKGKLNPHRGFFAEVIAQNGDMTMPELAWALHDATGVSAHPNAIGKFLRKLGYTHKKKSLVAAERRRAKVRQ